MALAAGAPSSGQQRGRPRPAPPAPPRLQVTDNRGLQRARRQSPPRSGRPRTARGTFWYTDGSDMALFFSSIWFDILAFVVAIFGFLYWYFTSTFNYWSSRGVPYLKPTPFFGNIGDFLLMRKSFNELYIEMYKQLDGHKYGGIFQLRTPTLFVMHPDTLKAVMVKDFQHFHDRGVHIPKTQVLGQHLFSLGGAKWRIMRTKLSPTFTSGKMKMMFALIDESSRRLRKYLAGPAAREEVVELKEVLARFSTDIIGSCAFGLQMNALENPDSEFRRMGRMFFDPKITKILKRAINFFVPDVAAHLELDDIEEEVTTFFMKVIRETIDYRIKNNVTRNDFIQLMMNLKYKGRVDDSEEADKLSTEEKRYMENEFELDDGLLTAQVYVFFLAGFETSSTTMSFAMHELAVNPELQRKLREEIDATLEKCGGQITYEALLGMKYMDKVVSETLRKYPPVPGLIRQVTIPYTLPDTTATLDVGTRVLIPVHAIHHDPKYYPEPDRYDPERFSEEEKSKRPNYTYLPFGEGPRNCIGMRFGLLQTKMGLLALLSEYEFHVCERTELPIRIDPRQIVTASHTGTILRISRRA